MWCLLKSVRILISQSWVWMCHHWQSKSWRICLDILCLTFQSLLYLLEQHLPFLVYLYSKNGWVDFLDSSQDVWSVKLVKTCKTCENLCTLWSTAYHHNSWGKSHLSCKINCKPSFFIFFVLVLNVFLRNISFNPIIIIFFMLGCVYENWNLQHFKS